MNKKQGAPPVSQEFLDEVRQHNLGHLLRALAIDFEQRVLQRFARIGNGDIRPTHGALLRNLELGGTRLTTLANRAGVTHRAMAKIVRDLQSMSYVDRMEDPADGRATLIVFAPRGLKLMRESQAEIDLIYDDYASSVGVDNLNRFEKLLKLAIRKLDIKIVKGGLQALENDTAAAVSERSPGSYSTPNLGRYLAELAEDYEKSCKTIMASLNHESIRVDLLAVLNYLDVAGMDHSDLADRAGISMQAIGRQVHRLAQLGYVYNEVCDQDKRSRRVSFSPRGYHLISDLLTAFQQIEYNHIEAIGLRNYRSLKRQLETFASKLHLRVPVKRAVTSI